ncbi:MAG: glycosyltransferase family 2 protein [Thermoanaerobaculia bacterium]
MGTEGNRDAVISIVVALHDEAENVEPLVDELVAVLRTLGEPFEIVLVDDGSTDDTWERIAAAHRRQPTIHGLSLLRNFGHQGAMLAGLSAATGRAVVTMDGDLQHPPEVIPRLVDAWRGGSRIVHTIRRDSADTGALKRWTSRLFYRVFSALSGIEVPPGSSDFRLLDWSVVDAVLEMRDPEPFLRGLVRWLGGTGTAVEFQARARPAGRSKFRLGRMLRLAVSGLVSFSTVPLRLGIWIGLATSALAFLEIVYIVVQYARGHTVPGWASVLTVISFMFGVLFILLGILGTYLASIHQAVKNRPAFLVAQRLGGSPAEPNPPRLTE